MTAVLEYSRLFLDVLECWLAAPDDRRPPYLTHHQIERRLAIRVTAWLTSFGVPIR
jgi:hypothetical protein